MMLENFIEKTSKFKSVTPWESIQENIVYHLPPIAFIKRKNILIIKKNDTEATYITEGDKSKKKHIMHKTSINAKFITNIRKF